MNTLETITTQGTEPIQWDNTPETLEHLFLVQKARCWEFARNSRETLKSFLILSPAKLTMAFAPGKQTYLNYNRMIKAKQAYEAAGGHYK